MVPGAPGRRLREHATCHLFRAHFRRMIRSPRQPPRKFLSAYFERILSGTDDTVDGQTISDGQPQPTCKEHDRDRPQRCNQIVEHDAPAILEGSFYELAGPWLHAVGDSER